MKNTQTSKKALSSIDIVTQRNDRGMIDLLQSLDGNPAKKAAKLLVNGDKPILICTGFPVSGYPETDGPPGTSALANALILLGMSVSIISWKETLDLLREQTHHVDLIDLTTTDSSIKCILRNYTLVTIEICSRTKDGSYRNMRAVDISDVAPDFENIVGLHSHISVGDGGNEFGMGSAPESFFKKWNVSRPVTMTDILVPASVSNFGAYAIVAEMELITGKSLLPRAEDHLDGIREMVNNGAVDGFTGEKKYHVDGQPLSETQFILEQLKKYVLDNQ